MHLFCTFFALGFIAPKLFGQGYPPQDPCTAPSANRWSETAPFNTLQDGDVAHIQSGQLIFLDVVTPRLDGVIVEGTLVLTECSTGYPELQSTWILVTGTLQAGKPAYVVEDEAYITLINEDIDPSHIPASLPSEIEDALLDRGLVITENGKLNLYGKNKGVGWCRLNLTAFGADCGGPSQFLSVDCDVQSAGWEVGDQIVIASTDYDWEQAEVRTIASITGNSIGLDCPLDFDHWGADVYGKGTNPDWKVNCRAEVGLLSRSVVVRGEDGDDPIFTNDFGHVQLLEGPTPGTKPKAEISWAQFTSLGIEGKKARYALHFHILNNLNFSSFVRNSSFFDCHNTFVTVHTTQKIEVTGNVGYLTTGHGFHLEEIDTYDVDLHSNLGLGVVRPDDANYPSAPANERVDTDFLKPAVFWLENPDIRVSDNAAAGSSHYGYWFNPLGDDHVYDGVNSYFKDNVSHSNDHHGFYQDDRPNPEAPQTGDPHTLSGLTSYKCRRYGVWYWSYGRVVLDDVRVADCRAGFYIASDGLANSGLSYITLQDSVIIGESENKGLGQYAFQGSGNPLIYPEHDRAVHEEDAGRSLPQPSMYLMGDNGLHSMPWDALSGVEFYDGFVEVDEVRFANFKDIDLRNPDEPPTAPPYLRPSGCTTQVGYDSPFAEDPRNRMRNLEFENVDPAGSPPGRKVYFRDAALRANMIANTIFFDEDGDLTSHGPNHYFMPRNPFLVGHVGLGNVIENTTHNYYAVTDAQADYAQLVIQNDDLDTGGLPVDWPDAIEVGVGVAFPPSIAQDIYTTPDSGTPQKNRFPFNVEMGAGANATEYLVTWDPPNNNIPPTQTPSELTVWLRFAEEVGDSLILGLPLLSSPSLVNYNGNQIQFPENDLIALRNASQQGFYYDSTNKILFVKFFSSVPPGNSLQWDGTEDEFEIQL